MLRKKCLREQEDLKKSHQEGIDALENLLQYREQEFKKELLIQRRHLESEMRDQKNSLATHIEKLQNSLQM